MHDINNSIKKICVFCASSSQASESYMAAAKKLGQILARNNISVIYGGGAIGLMGKLADSVLENDGKIIGVIPQFMVELEWAREGLSQLIIVETMHERKRLMLEGTDAVIALPGGSGTLEELMESITFKRLGIYISPIIILNTNNFYGPLIDMFNQCISERFMKKEHSSMWSFVDHPEDIPQAINNAPEWSKQARNFAVL